MNVFQDKKKLKAALAQIKSERRSIGFVPTMGALHMGHLSLVGRALAENHWVVVSIFVNPTQFDKVEDLEKYPTNLKKDISLLHTISKEIMVFAPTKEEIYDGEVRSRKFNLEGLDETMEGAFRTGHFDGVATIVELLFKAVEPTRAYFGEKDFQQLQIVKKMVEQVNLPVQIIPCPIDREPNGLARSSRNERLSPATRKAAGFIYKVLLTAKGKFGMESVNTIKEWVLESFHGQDLFDLEYFEIAETTTLAPIITFEPSKKYRAFIAVYAEGIRLIDNIALN